MKQTAQNTPRVLVNQFSVYYLGALLPVLFAYYATSYYEHAESLLPLFFVEWTLVVVVFYFLCPWLGKKGVLYAAVVVLLSLCVSAIVVHESFVTYGTLWTGSDDWRYLSDAGCVMDSLLSSGWNLSGVWAELILSWDIAWAQAGWPFLLGLVSSCVTSDSSPEILHAVALSLNATFLALVLALVYHVLHEPAQRFPRMVLVCFLLMIGSPIVYAGQCLKESMLQLSLMLSFVFCVKLSKRIQVQWIILGLLGITGVLTTRVAYIPLILFVLYWMVLDRMRMGTVLKVVLGLVLCALFWRMIYGFQIGGYTVGEVMGGVTLEAESGLAMFIYNIPLVGPILYYAISPVPPLPWKILSHDQIVTTLIQGAGSVAWFFAVCYVLRGIVRNRLLLKNKLFVAAAIMFVGIFIAVVLRGNDPRYKQPTNFYLSIMLFVTWYDSRTRRSSRRLPVPGDSKRNISSWVNVE